MIINILGKKIKVKYRDMTKENVCGHYIYAENLIEINNKMDKETQLITLVHEIIHAVLARSGVHNARISHDVEEIISDQVAKVIIENFILKKRK